MSEVKDLPDYTKQHFIWLNADYLTQIRNLPWWVRYSPRRIIFLDDIEGELKWGSDGGSIAKGNSRMTFEGAYNLQLITGAAIGNDAGAQIVFSGEVKSKCAVQARWNFGDAAQNKPQYFDIILYCHTGTKYYLAGVRYLLNWAGLQQKWQYLTGAEVWTDIPEGSEIIKIPAYAHQSIYFLVDFTPTILKYSRLVTSKLDLDLSALDFVKYDDVDPAYFAVTIHTATNVNEALTTNVDAVCVSDEEP